MTYTWESPHRDVCCSEIVFPWARWSPLSIFKARLIDTNLTYGGYAEAMVMIPYAFSHTAPEGPALTLKYRLIAGCYCSNEFYSNVYASVSICSFSGCLCSVLWWNCRDRQWEHAQRSHISAQDQHILIFASIWAKSKRDFLPEYEHQKYLEYIYIFIFSWFIQKSVANKMSTYLA